MKKRATIVFLLLMTTLLLCRDYTLKVDELMQVRVVNVVNGDTIDVSFDASTVRVRLIGVDCPERGHAHSNQLFSTLKHFWTKRKGYRHDPTSDSLTTSPQATSPLVEQ